MSRGTGRQARASLSVRIILGVAAAVMLIVAALATVNLRATVVYNQATQTLTADLKAMERDNPDLNALNLKQQQTDAQFKDAASLSSLLLPDIKSSIEHNTAVSQALSEQIKAALNRQQNGGSGSNATPKSGSSSSPSTPSGTDTGGLTKEQRQKIEQLLQGNQQQSSSDSSSSSSSSTSKPSGESTNTKPW